MGSVTAKKKTTAKKPVVKKKPEKKKPNITKKAIKTVKAKGGLIGNLLEKNDTVTIDLCGVELTNNQLEFIINYVTPCQPCFHNAFQSALKAGYSENVANKVIYGFLNRPDIQKIIRANEHLIYNAVHGSAMRALQVKQQRAFYDPADYYDEEDVNVTENGKEYTKTVTRLKPFKKMTPEQRLCVDGREVKGQSAIPVYLLPDRGKELNDLIKIDSDMSKSKDDNSDNEDETMEIIMERLTLKKTVRKEKEEISETAKLIRQPKGSIITEL
jgi:phage terminase small subunit